MFQIRRGYLPRPAPGLFGSMSQTYRPEKRRDFSGPNSLPLTASGAVDARC